MTGIVTFPTVEITSRELIREDSGIGRHWHYNSINYKLVTQFESLTTNFTDFLLESQTDYERGVKGVSDEISSCIYELNSAMQDAPRQQSFANALSILHRAFDAAKTKSPHTKVIIGDNSYMSDADTDTLRKAFYLAGQGHLVRLERRYPDAEKAHPSLKILKEGAKAFEGLKGQDAFTTFEKVIQNILQHAYSGEPNFQILIEHPEDDAEISGLVSTKKRVPVLASGKRGLRAVPSD